MRSTAGGAAAQRRAHDEGMNLQKAVRVVSVLMVVYAVVQQAIKVLGSNDDSKT